MGLDPNLEYRPLTAKFRLTNEGYYAVDHLTANCEVSATCVSAMCLSAVSATLSGLVIGDIYDRYGRRIDFDDIATCSIDITTLEIDGAALMSEALAAGDLIIVDNGGGGSNQGCAISRVKTYVLDGSGNVPLSKLDMTGSGNVPLSKLDMSTSGKVPLSKVDMTGSGNIPLSKIDLAGSGVVPLSKLDMSTSGKVPTSKIDSGGNLTVGSFRVNNSIDVAKKLAVSGNVEISGAMEVSGSVVIGPDAVNSKAALDVQSTTKSFLPPRMTTTQRNAISSPPAGSVIYNATTNLLNHYNGSAWLAVGAVAAGASETKAFYDALGGTQTVTILNGLITSWTS